jgi:DNA end-binding protein Ku
MARAMWRGAIQFGLVTIPVRLYLATESRGGLSFNLLHAEDGRRIQMRIHCPEHGEIPRSETVRGYEWSKGHYVVIEESDLEAVPLKTVRSIEIEQFVPARRDREEAVFVKQSYYLEPEPVGRKAFALLRTVLADSELQAVCKIVLKDREQLAALDPFGPTLLLSTLYWPDEVRDVGELEVPAEEIEIKPVELQMAHQLVDALTGEFDPSRYHDEYREALLKVIEAKVDGRPMEAPEPVAETSKLTDLMAVLEASVAAARGEAASATSRGPKAKAGPVKEEPLSVADARKARAGREKAPSGARGKAASGGRAAGRSTSDRATKAAADADEPATASRATSRRRKTA